MKEGLLCQKNTIMKEKTISQWSKDLLQETKKVAMPIMTHPGIELINASVYDAVTNGEVHFKAIDALCQKYPSAAATMIMDLTVEAEAFGCHVNFEKEEIPTVKERLLQTVDEIEQLEIPVLKECKRVNEYLKAAKLAVKNISNIPIFPGCIGPFSLAGRLIDMSEIMVDIYLYPDQIHQLLQKCTDFIKEYIDAYKALGADGVIMAEPAAGLLGEDECDQFSSRYIKTIVDELQDDNFMIVLHNCGHKGNLVDSMLSTGSKALHFGNAADMKYVLDNAPKDILMMGNIDPVNVMQTGTPEFIKQETFKLLETGNNYPNFIISTGCDVPPAVSHENIESFFETVKEFNDCL